MNDSGMIVLLTLLFVMISIICNICQLRQDRKLRAQFEQFIFDYLKEESIITNRLIDITTAVVVRQQRMSDSEGEER